MRKLVILAWVILFFLLATPPIVYHYSIPQSKGEVILDETRSVSPGEVVIYNLTDPLLPAIVGWRFDGWANTVQATIKSLVGNLTLFRGCYSTNLTDLEQNYTELCQQNPIPVNTNSFNEYIGVSYFIVLVFGTYDIYRIRIVFQE